MGPTPDGRLKPDVAGVGYYDYRPPEGVEMQIKSIRLNSLRN